MNKADHANTLFMPTLPSRFAIRFEMDKMKTDNILHAVPLTAQDLAKIGRGDDPTDWTPIESQLSAADIIAIMQRICDKYDPDNRIMPQLFAEMGKRKNVGPHAVEVAWQGLAEDSKAKAKNNGEA